MAIIQKIRNRSGLMLVVIGGCLVLFILNDALSKSGGMSDGDPNSVGEVDGVKISREEYNQFVTSMENNAQQRGQTLSDYNKQQFNEQAWNTLVDLAIRDEEYDAVGISSSDDEVTDMFFQDQYVQYFSRKLGVKAEAETLREAIKNTDNKEVLAEVDLYEHEIRRQLNYMKYQRLVQAGFIPTQAEAKYQYELNTITNAFRVAMLPYSTVVDSTIKVSEDEIKEAYNKEKDNYKQKESRDIRFVAFRVEASAADEAKVRAKLDEVKTRFAAFKGNDAIFVNTESDGASAAENTYFAKGKGLPAIMDSSFAALQEGQIFGPYMEFNGSKKVLKLAKVSKVKMLADSVKVKHILISVRGAENIPGSENFHLTTQQRMMDVTDSLEKILKTKPELFDQMVMKHSDDIMSAIKGGDIGWISKSSQYEALFDSCMLAKEGTVVKVFSNRDGMHLVKIVQQGTLMKKVNAGIISRELRPSQETLNQLYVTANDFSDALKGGKNIDTVAADRHLTVAQHGGLTRNDLYVNGLEGARGIVKWTFNANVGEASSVFQLSENYVVAVVEKEFKEGVKSIEDVKKELEAKLNLEKKGVMLAEKINAALAKGENLDQLKAKFPELILDSIPATPIGGSLAQFGNEPDVMGMAAAIPVNKLSKAIVGKQGVYVVLVHKRDGGSFHKIKDYSPEQNDIAQKTKTLVEQFISEALKTGVDIEDGRFEKMD
ncbi:MAG: SurA N-terminal domain-containing protein [Bacteroidetes bacterium]|nr:SurA N-terminal domain-containing protein [Bacteroidota bacterium]